jgi:hypothetical protein
MHSAFTPTRTRYSRTDFARNSLPPSLLIFLWTARREKRSLSWSSRSSPERFRATLWRRTPKSARPRWPASEWHGLPTCSPSEGRRTSSSGSRYALGDRSIFLASSSTARPRENSSPASRLSMRIRSACSRFQGGIDCPRKGFVNSGLPFQKLNPLKGADQASTTPNGEPLAGA